MKIKKKRESQIFLHRRFFLCWKQVLCCLNFVCMYMYVFAMLKTTWFVWLDREKRGIGRKLYFVIDFWCYKLFPCTNGHMVLTVRTLSWREQAEGLTQSPNTAPGAGAAWSLPACSQNPSMYNSYRQARNARQISQTWGRYMLRRAWCTSFLHGV